MSMGEVLDDALRGCNPIPEGHDDIEARLERARFAEKLNLTPEPVIVSRYVVTEKIGSGGMGRVFAAFDPMLKRRVAIKLLRTDPDEFDSERLIREGQAMAQISHPNVMQVHDVGLFEGSVYIMMELVEGSTLRTWQEKEQPGADEILNVYAQAGEGLAAIHSSGFVHRDIKPENIFIDESRRVKVGDLGLVYAIRETERDEQTAESTSQSRDELSYTLTQAGGLIGTPLYMSPEQLRGERAGELSDQFSFCVVLWEALFGQRPFPGRKPAEIIEAMPRGPVLPLERRGPAGLIRILQRGLSLMPDDRFSSMRALLDAISHARHRRRVMTIWGGVGLATAAVLTAAFAWHSYDPCADAGEELASVWNDARKAKMREVMAALATDQPIQQAWQSLQEAFDSAAQEWSEQSQGLCRTERSGGMERSERRARQTCLDVQRVTLETFANRMGKVLANPAALEQMTNELARLKGECSTARLFTYAGTALSPGDKHTLLEVAERIADAELQEFIGEYKAAEMTARDAAKRARTLSIPRIRARGHYRLAHVLGQMGDYYRAADALQNAIGVAGEAGDRHSMADSFIYGAKLEAECARQGSCRNDSRELRKGCEDLRGEDWLDDSELVLRMLGWEEGDPWPDDLNDRLRLADYYDAKGLMFMEKGEHSQAAGEFERSLDLRRIGSTEKARLDVTKSLTNLGNALSCADRYSEAIETYEKARDQTIALLGERHPLTAQSLANLAEAKSQVREFDEARKLVLSAIAIYRDAGLLDKVEADRAYRIWGDNEYHALVAQGASWQRHMEHRAALGNARLEEAYMRYACEYCGGRYEVEICKPDCAAASPKADSAQ